jgi:hypothetical protein
MAFTNRFSGVDVPDSKASSLGKVLEDVTLGELYKFIWKLFLAGLLFSLPFMVIGFVAWAGTR